MCPIGNVFETLAIKIIFYLVHVFEKAYMIFLNIEINVYWSKDLIKKMCVLRDIKYLFPFAVRETNVMLIVPMKKPSQQSKAQFTYFRIARLTEAFQSLSIFANFIFKPLINFFMWL